MQDESNVWSIDQTEEEFLASYDPSRFYQLSVAVDVVLLSVVDRSLHVGLVQRTEHPNRGRWSLPGGFVGLNESLDATAARVLATKASLKSVYVEQLYTFGAPKRDPRTRVIAVAYYALVDAGRLSQLNKRGMILASIEVPWRGETGGPVLPRSTEGKALELGFDHRDIIGMAVKRIRGKLNYSPIGFQLLPETFTLRQLQDTHEAILDEATNKDSFRRRMLASGDLEATGEREDAVGHRPAELYRFQRTSAI